MTGHDREVSQLRFFPDDGNRMVSASRDGTVRIWDLDSGSSRIVHEHPGNAFCVAVSDDGNWLASGGWDRAVRVTDLWDDRSQTLYGHRHMVNDLTFTDDGTLVSVGGDRMDPTSSSLAIRWAVDRGTWSERSRDPFGDAIMCVDRADKRQSVWLAGYHETPLSLLDSSDSDDTVRCFADNSIAWDLAGSSDRQWLVGGDGEGRLRLWRTDELDRPTTWKLGPTAGEVHAVALSPDDRLVAVACGNGTVMVLEINP